MRFARWFLLTLALTGLATAPALAGKNAGGAMIVHTNDSYNYSAQTVCTTAAGDPGTCETAVTQATRDTGQVIWLLAAFPEGTSPGVSVVYFGIDYDDANLDPGVNYKNCGPAGTVEVADPDWPYSGRGNSIGFGSPIVGDLLFPFYVFRIDGGTDGSFFGTGINPTGGYAAFFDDNQTDPVRDDVTRFGTVQWFAAGSNACPVLSPGACCFDDGSCTVVMADVCAEQDGVFQGLDTVCQPNPCPPPQVCCNIQTQECRFLPPDRCQALGEFWEVVNVTDAPSCDGAPCDTGACCQGTGACEIRQRYSCAKVGGVFQGTGTVCDPNPCPQPGACCNPTNGACQVMLRTTCEGQGWIFQGVGTSCNPNPCPQPSTGACCILAACSVRTEAVCLNSGGTYLGNGTDCDPNPCSGACCVPGSTCTPKTPPDCDALGGTFQGLGTTCTPDPCDHACCKADGTCEMLTQAECTAGGGTPRVPDVCTDLPSPCADNYACCMLDGTCMIATVDECGQEDGTFLQGNFCAPDNSCIALEPCCFQSGRCLVLLADDCIGQGGTVLADTTCAPINPCFQPEPGACCKDDGSCEVLVEYLCLEIENARYQGAETTCEPDPCPEPESCCFPDGTCEVLVPYLCQDRGGISHGDASCFPNPCPQPPVGACCDPNYGTCQLKTEAACSALGNSYLGPETVCDPNPCPEPLRGACCYMDGVCEMLPGPLCDQARGTFLGLDVSCDPYPCLGACCPGDETCIMNSRAECMALGGLYLGDGTDCGTQENICLYSPTEATSWGRIRALFR